MFFGREYNPQELQRLCGSTRQIGRIVPFQLSDGKEKGVRCLQFFSGSGFNFTVVPDRGMDIAFAEYKGMNLVWQSPTGVVGPEHYEPYGWGWIRGFFAGMLTTCGILNIGIPDAYNDEPLGAHGRISYTPATNVSFDTVWIGDDLHLLARGEMREVRPPFYNLVVRRRIRAIAGLPYFTVHDTVTNEGYERVPHQILYHINIGFPVLSRSSYVLAPSRVCTPRDQDAEEAKEHWRLCSDPTPHYREKVYYHDVAACTDDRAWAAVVNPELEGGLGVYVKYDPVKLPVLVQWKMMGEGMYVMGIEPSNSYGIGMARQHSLGLLKYIDPGQQIDYQLEIGVMTGQDEIGVFEREVAVVAPTEPEYASILV